MQSRSRTFKWRPGKSVSPPVDNGQNFQYTLTTLGRLREPEEFENIVIKTAQVRPGAASELSGGNYGRHHARERRGTG